MCECVCEELGWWAGTFQAEGTALCVKPERLRLRATGRDLGKADLVGL